MQDLAVNAAIALGILTNYKKYEMRNPYLTQLSELQTVHMLQLVALKSAEAFTNVVT